MNSSFAQLNLKPQLLTAIAEMGFEEPTPIQATAIPALLQGKDIIGQAQTGTGKTAAFGLPILNQLQAETGQVQALIVTPTRELALQVARALADYGRHVGARVLAIYGGQPYGQQKRQLRRGVDIVVGTPGRLLDLIKQTSLDLSALQTVVLDEADEMLSMGFIEDIETILQAAPEKRQTALFSATLPAEIRRLAARYQTDPLSVTMPAKQLTVAAIEQRFYLVNEADKTAALTRLFEVEPMTAVLIFARTRVRTAELANELTARGFASEVLNGDLSQDAREHVMRRFRSGQVKVLVATDVAARGLDIDNISHVINFDLPSDAEIYVHRVGRTGRAGKTGIAISLATPKEQYRLRKIERYTRQKMQRATLPSVADILAYRETQLVEQMLVWLKRGRCRRERDIVEELVTNGNDALEIAAAALKLARGEEKQRPIDAIGEPKMEQQRPEKRGRHSRSGKQSGPRRSGKGMEKGMVRLTMSAGKAQGVRPNDVVGTIAFHADIPGRVIGAIQIQERQTLVDVPERFVAQVLDKSGRYQIRRNDVSIEQTH